MACSIMGKPCFFEVLYTIFGMVAALILSTSSRNRAATVPNIVFKGACHVVLLSACEKIKNYSSIIKKQRLENQKLKVEIKNYSHKTKKKCYLCNAREMKGNAEERPRTALVRFGKLGILVFITWVPAFFWYEMKDYRFTKETFYIGFLYLLLFFLIKSCC